MESSFQACGLTDIGRKRADNQDQFLIAELHKSMLIRASSLPPGGSAQILGECRGQLLVVADGMGGHAAGQRASSVALQELISELLNKVHWTLKSDLHADDDFVRSLQELLQHAHTKVLAEAATDRSWRGMGTTLTVAQIVWPRLYVVHAGDSRCYLIRDGVGEQLTTDHTLAHQLVEAGGMKPEDEASSRWSNVLWNVLGGSGEQELVAEVARVDLRKGDVVLLCSDGLSRYVPPPVVADIVASHDPTEACRRLVDLANEAGGEDNITVIVSHPFGPTALDDEHDTVVGGEGDSTASSADVAAADDSYVDEETWPE